MTDNKINIRYTSIECARAKFKKLMDDYYFRYETLEKVRKEEDRIVYVTHTLPRRAGEMDLRIDTSPNQLYFEAIAYSVSIHMALVASVLGM